jgi:hypothetical protein
VSRGIRIALLLAAGVLIASCGGGARYAWPEPERERWMASCESYAPASVCGCVLRAYEENIPYDDAVAFQEGRSPYQKAGSGLDASSEWEEMNWRMAEASMSCPGNEWHVDSMPDDSHRLPVRPTP